VEIVSYPGNLLFPPKFPNMDDAMVIIGVTHCPSCKAVVNANWPSCLACSLGLEHSNPAHSSVRVQASKEPAAKKLKAVADETVIQPDMIIHYEIPSTGARPTDSVWEWHQGRVERIDEDWQIALIIPDTEPQPWRWVSLVYIQAAES